MFASSWTRWGCSLGQGKRNFSGRMDVCTIISASSCNTFCFLQSGRANSHSGTQGKKAVSFLGKDFCFSQQACLTWVCNNNPDSQRVQEQPTACPPDRAEVAPSQVRCTGHPAWYPAFDSSKNKGYFQQACEPFLQPLCWHPQVWKQEFRGHLPSESVQCPFMGLVPMHAHKPFLNLPTLLVSTPPVAASSTNSWLQCEEVLPSALSWSSIKIENHFC